jgi:hypothetical protein
MLHIRRRESGAGSATGHSVDIGQHCKVFLCDSTRTNAGTLTSPPRGPQAVALKRITRSTRRLGSFSSIISRNARTGQRANPGYLTWSVLAELAWRSVPACQIDFIIRLATDVAYRTPVCLP